MSVGKKLLVCRLCHTQIGLSPVGCEGFAHPAARLRRKYPKVAIHIFVGHSSYFLGWNTQNIPEPT